MPGDLFAGTAWYYARYRPGYPEELFDLIIERFGLDGGGRLLDLGCGTGQMLLPLAAHVAYAMGLDPDPGMLAEAELARQRAGAHNVRFLRGGSMDLARMTPQLGDFHIVTMGRSFHWMDGVATLRSLAGILVPGGGIAIAGDGCGLWNGTKPWERAITATIQRWLGERRRAGGGFWPQQEDPWDVYLPRIAEPLFSQPEFHQLRFQREWTLERIIGHLYSTSFCSVPLLGDNRAAFEADLRERLLELHPDDSFQEDVVLDAVFLWKA